MLIAPQSFKKVVIVENMHFYKNDVCGNNFHIIQLSQTKEGTGQLSKVKMI